MKQTSVPNFGKKSNLTEEIPASKRSTTICNSPLSKTSVDKRNIPKTNSSPLSGLPVKELPGMSNIGKPSGNMPLRGGPPKRGRGNDFGTRGTPQIRGQPTNRVQRGQPPNRAQRGRGFPVNRGQNTQRGKPNRGTPHNISTPHPLFGVIPPK